MYIYIFIYWAPRAIYSVQAVKTAHLLITFSFSLPRETSKSQAGMRQLWVILTHSHQDPEILHAIGGWYLAWDYLSRNEPLQWFWCCQCGETFPLRSGSLFCLFLPTTYAAYVTGADSCDSFVWQSITLNQEDGMSGIEGQSFPGAVINRAYP